MYGVPAYPASFTPLFTYKVLKLVVQSNRGGVGFHTFIYLQGSQTSKFRWSDCLEFHTFIYLQGSQTDVIGASGNRTFHTFIYLQGSQTSNFFQGHHRTHNILAYVQAFSLYQRKTFSKLVMLICNNAIVIVKNIQFFTISFVICTEFYQHQLYFTICGHFVQLGYLLIC